jgi:hypothetical protein
MRYRLEVIGAAVTGLAAAITAIVPDWIEEVFGVDPDSGSGALEWLIVVALALATVAFSALAWRTRGRLGGFDPVALGEQAQPMKS